ncbi:MAG: SRPBCC family protein [Acidimicrobiales bacterium]
MAGYRFRFTLPATPEEVWPLIGEAARWKDWTLLSETKLVREGAPVPDGVGALRRFAVAGVGSLEEVVAWEPPRHLGYVGVKGIPAKHYRADVCLEAVPEGTEVTWSGELTPLFPGSGWFAVLYARGALGMMTRGLRRYVARGGR